MSEHTTETNYFTQRMADMGVTSQQNVIDLLQYDAEAGDNVLKPVPVFSYNEKLDGIDILVYTLNRTTVRIAKNTNSRWKDGYKITRLAEPKVNKKGDVMKYYLPKGEPTLPFFPPHLVEAYDNKTEIPVLYLTEGYFKAFKADMHGIYCVGLVSINCMTDTKGKLYEDIFRIIETCKVQRLVWLTDGDCRDITNKPISEEDPETKKVTYADLYRRPNNFFITIQKFVELTSSLENVQKYFAHINTDNLEGRPKGLDDLLIAFPKETEAITAELNKFDEIITGKYEGTYTVKFNVTYNLGKVRSYFLHGDITNFYLYHVERNSRLKGQKFRYSGSIYQYNEESGKCEVQIPKEASSYFRVANDYYKIVELPQPWGNTITTFRRRLKETIKDDCGKDIFKFIPKYEEFVNIPNHENYQQIVNSSYNMYHPFDHEAEEGDCPTILSFLQHIFGTHEITVTHKDGKEFKVKYYELGLDYLSLLYKKPQHILPILCLVSEERQTGKTTFLKFLKMLFTENVAIVGNDDLGGNFNSHWAPKLVIACDETKIDKHTVVEKVKSMSTSNEVQLNAKGRDQITIPFFGKFILCSNNVDNFINIDKHEIRFWVLNVTKLKDINVHLEDSMKEEIPAFLHLLNKRKMVTDRQERHWFDTKLLVTDALRKVQENSAPQMQKRINIELQHLFSLVDKKELTIPLKAIADEILKRPQDSHYIGQVLNNMGYKVGKVIRGEYPRVQEKKIDAGVGEQFDDKGYAFTTKPVKFNARAYTFKREDFIDPQDETEDTPKPNDTTDLPF